LMVILAMPLWISNKMSEYSFRGSQTTVFICNSLFFLLKIGFYCIALK
jgi:hypothetical protein